MNPHLLFNVNAWVRRDGYDYYPSSNPFADFTPALQSATVGQSRSLLNAGGHIEMSYVHGVHNILAGIQYEDTILNESESFGLVDPTANAPCLNADGSPDTNPLVTSQSQCTAL